MITNQLKGNIILGWLFICYQAFPSSRLSFSVSTHYLFWLSIDFFSFRWSQSRPQNNLKKLKTYFLPSSYSKKMNWGQGSAETHYLLFCGFKFLCVQLSKNIKICFLKKVFLVLILQSTCFICITWKRKQTMEQQPPRACEGVHLTCLHIFFSVQVKSGACYITSQWGQVQNKIKKA